MLKCITYIISYFILLSTYAFGNLIRPENGTELSYIHVCFEWEQEPDAIEYNLQVSTQQSFNHILLDTNESTSVHIDKGHLNWDDDYY